MSTLDWTLIGGLIGGLSGLVAFLVKTLIVSKDERITDLVDERDFYRDGAIAGGTQLPDHEAWYQRRHPPQHR
jgi:hypothetical protein